MKKTLMTTSINACLIVFAVSAIAAVPNIVNYRGRLVGAGGSPVSDGPHLIKFIIYDAAVGGTELWNSNFQSVTTNGGLFDYRLGSVSALPLNLVTDNASLFLGITIGTDQEISPRTAFSSGMYSYYSGMADSSQASANASKLGGQTPAHYLDWSNLTGLPVGFADGVDNVGSGDITGVTAGAGLSGGGAAGSVTLGIAPGGVTSSHIANGTIQQTDLSFTPGDITNVSAGAGLRGGGTLGAVSLNLDPINTQYQIFSNTAEFRSLARFGDSTLRINNNGIMIGRNFTPGSNSTSLLSLARVYNISQLRYGLEVSLINKSGGVVYGISSRVGGSATQGSGSLYGLLGVAGTSAPNGPTGRVYGVFGASNGAYTSINPRYGVYGAAGSRVQTKGNSYGVYGEATCGSGAWAFGVYGTTSGTGVRYAGYFSGNTHVTGTLSKGAGAFKIDHPLDPANKYLQHSFVESPDMMNVYNGNVITDSKGEATITMPDYFETLNRDFRYQLTAIGAPGPNLYIADEISGNTFRIAGADPGMKISWQLTGIRQDAYANAHRIEVEVNKPANEKGLYMHPVERGLSETLQLHYEQNKQAEGLPPNVRGQ